jgi:APA family basic amino acid/polyamine antiporter
VVYTEWVFFGLMAIGLFIFRKRRGLKREYSAWGYPVIPAVFALSAFAIAASQIISDPVESMWGLGFVLLGIPVYFVWARRGFIEEKTG